MPSCSEHNYLCYGVPTCPICYPKTNTTSTLNGKWPSDTWFQRARKRALMEQAQEIEASNDKPQLSKVQL